MNLLIWIVCGLILSPFLIYFLSYVQAQAWIDVFFKNVKKGKNGKKEEKEEE